MWTVALFWNTYQRPHITWTLSRSLAKLTLMDGESAIVWSLKLTIELLCLTSWEWIHFFSTSVFNPSWRLLPKCSCYRCLRLKTGTSDEREQIRVEQRTSDSVWLQAPSNSLISICSVKDEANDSSVNNTQTFVWVHILCPDYSRLLNSGSGDMKGMRRNLQRDIMGSVTSRYTAASTHLADLLSIL